MECGACSKEKFLDSDEYNAIKVDFILGIAIPVCFALFGIIYCSWYYCCRGRRHFYYLKIPLKCNSLLLIISIRLKSKRRCKNAFKAKEDEAAHAQTVFQDPAPAQPAMQPATTIVINNTGFQPAPTQFQPQEQVN